MTVWNSRDSQRVKAIREVLDEFQMRSKLLEPHQYKASNRLRGKTLLRILLIMKEDWDGKGELTPGIQNGA